MKLPLVSVVLLSLAIAGNAYASVPSKWSLIVRRNNISHDIPLYPSLVGSDDDMVAFDSRFPGVSCEYGEYSNALVVDCHTGDWTVSKHVVLRSGEEKAEMYIRFAGVAPSGKEVSSVIILRFDPDGE